MTSARVEMCPGSGLEVSAQTGSVWTTRASFSAADVAAGLCSARSVLVPVPRSPDTGPLFTVSLFSVNFFFSLLQN